MAMSEPAVPTSRLSCGLLLRKAARREFSLSSTRFNTLMVLMSPSCPSLQARFHEASLASDAPFAGSSRGADLGTRRARRQVRDDKNLRHWILRKAGPQVENVTFPLQSKKHDNANVQCFDGPPETASSTTVVLPENENPARPPETAVPVLKLYPAGRRRRWLQY